MRAEPYDEIMANRDLAIDELELSKCMATHHQKGVYYGIQYSLWDQREGYYKNEITRKEGKLYHLYREQLEEELGRKPTEAQISASIDADDDLHALKTKLLKSRQQTIAYKAAFDKMKNQKDVLVSLANTQRAEMNAELSVKRHADTDISRAKELQDRGKSIGAAGSA